MQQLPFLIISVVAIGVAVIVWHRFRLKAKTKAALRERQMDTFASFSIHFASKNVQPEVLRSVYAKLSTSTHAKEMPVRPQDELKKDWGFDDDYEGLVFDLCKELGIPYSMHEEKKQRDCLTVEELVLYLSEIKNSQ